MYGYGPSEKFQGLSWPNFVVRRSTSQPGGLYYKDSPYGYGISTSRKKGGRLCCCIVATLLVLLIIGIALLVFFLADRDTATTPAPTTTTASTTTTTTDTTTTTTDTTTTQTTTPSTPESTSTMVTTTASTTTTTTTVPETTTVPTTTEETTTMAMTTVAETTPEPTTTVAETTTEPTTTVATTTDPTTDCDAAADIVLLLDSTNNFTSIREFAANLTERFDVPTQARFACTAFGSFARTEFVFLENTDPDMVVQEILNKPEIEIAEPVDTEAALTVASTLFTPGNGDRPDAPNFVIFVTASELDSDISDEVGVLEGLGANLITVGIGISNFPNTTLAGSSFFDVEDDGGLNDILNPLVSRICDAAT